MDALLILAVQLTVQIIMAITRLAMMASIMIGQDLGWLLMAAWRSRQQRRQPRRWR